MEGGRGKKEWRMVKGRRSGARVVPREEGVEGAKGKRELLTPERLDLL